jgi:uncharacterized repeat protein (TIGR01451 family)
VKTASAQIVKSGDVITYTITLNVTAGLVSNATVTDVLPDNLIFVGFGTEPIGVTPNWDGGHNLTWSWSFLSPGVVSFTYQARVDNYVQQGTILRNHAQLTYDGLANPKESHVDITMATLYKVHVGVYNAVGEMVKEIWVQQLSEEIKDFDIFESPMITSVHGKVYVDYQGVQIATWDGTNQSGDPVTNGKYHLKVDNVDAYGTVDSVSHEVMVSRSIAKEEVIIFNEAGEAVRHLYSYIDDANGLTLGDVTLSTTLIKPSTSGTPVPGENGVVNITSPNGMNLTWDGRSDTGAIVTNGHYEVEVHYTNGKNGEEVVSRGVIVQSSNTSVTNGKVYAKPNVLKGGLTQTTLEVKSDVALTIHCKLYNTAGELVMVVEGGTGTKQANLNLSKLASGLYFVVVDLTDAQGRFAAHQVTQIVLEK